MDDVEHEVPATLLEAIQFFADPDVALEFVVKLHWPDGVVRCPRCQSVETSFLSTRRIWCASGKRA
jgi:hypothetical protein